MAKQDDKFTRAAHIKRHTKGTSNEISFSVLDAARETLDDKRNRDGVASRFGKISLFTLPGRRKKPSGTPVKEQGLPLSDGGFAAAGGKGSLSRYDALDFASSAVEEAKDSKRGDDRIEGGALANGAAALPAADRLSVEVESSTARDIGAALVQEVAPSLGRAGDGLDGLGALGGLGVRDNDVSRETSHPAKPPRSPEEEVARRKARRRLSRIAAAVVVVSVVAALTAVGGFYLYKEVRHQRENVNLLNEALNLVNEADQAIIEMDDLVSNPFGEDFAGRCKKVQDGLEQTASSLSAADEKARAASMELRDAREKEAANQTVAAVSARKELLSTGGQLLEDAQRAWAASVSLEEAWEAVLEADALARDAAELVTDATAENVQASKDKTNEALTAFAEARSALESVQASFPDADLSSLMGYVDKRVEALSHAVSSNDALLAKNKEEASAQNDAYNAADAEAVSLARSLPADPSDIVFEAYERVTERLSESYATARSQAGTADAFIRDYLGAGSK